MSSHAVSAVDAAVRSSLLDFICHVFDTNWMGREHEAISLYVLGYLRHCFTPDRAVLREPTQICIQGTVPGVPDFNPKGRVNKDLLIWPPDHRTCWDREGRVANAPLCVMEWKVFRLPSSRPHISEYDVEWLEGFAMGREDFVGYAVSVDLADREFRLSVTRVEDGDRESDWLRL